MFEWIKMMFNKFLRAFRAFIEVAIPAITQVLIGQLKDIALEIVKELASTDLTNEEKRNQAFERIKTYSISHGISISDSLINLVIELAVQVWKNTQ